MIDLFYQHRVDPNVPIEEVAAEAAWDCDNLRFRLSPMQFSLQQARGFARCLLHSNLDNHLSGVKCSKS